MTGRGTFEAFNSNLAARSQTALFLLRNSLRTRSRVPAFSIIVTITSCDWDHVSNSEMRMALRRRRFSRSRIAQDVIENLVFAHSGPTQAHPIQVTRRSRMQGLPPRVPVLIVVACILGTLTDSMLSLAAGEGRFVGTAEPVVPFGSISGDGKPRCPEQSRCQSAGPRRVFLPSCPPSSKASACTGLNAVRPTGDEVAWSG